MIRIKKDSIENPVEFDNSAKNSLRTDSILCRTFRLTPKEVQDIIGHELGHFYRYYLLNQRFRAITLMIGAMSGLLVTHWIGMSSIFSMVALSLCGSACWMVSGWLAGSPARHGYRVSV